MKNIWATTDKKHEGLLETVLCDPIQPTTTEISVVRAGDAEEGIPTAAPRANEEKCKIRNDCIRARRSWRRKFTGKALSKRKDIGHVALQQENELSAVLLS